MIITFPLKNKDNIKVYDRFDSLSVKIFVYYNHIVGEFVINMSIHCHV